jgi:hypothetical protein
MVYLQRPKTKKVVVAQLHEQDSDQPKSVRYHIEYVDMSTDEAAANESLRKSINEKLRWGWRLLRVSRDPSGDGLELVWDTSGSQITDSGP